MNKHSTARKQFFRYVSQNILGMIGVSAYILADTFFIAQAQGADGIAALNLVLPVYSLIFALGAMLATGAATRFALERHEGKTRRWLSCGSPHMGGNFVCAVHPAGHFQRGGHRAAAWRRTGHRDGRCAVYTHFPAFHALLHVQLHPALLRPQRRRSVACHDRDDGIQPVQYRYGLGADVPLGMGMAGAALATAASPIVGMGINALHFRKKTNTLRFRWHKPTFKLLAHVSAVGVSGFIGESRAA